MNRHCSFLLALAASAEVVSGANVSFQSVAGTFDQGGNYVVGRTIDGLFNDQGWGVFGGQNTDQTAVFQTTAPVAANEIGFYLPQSSGFAGHYINRFRLAYTTDAVPAFGGNWTQIAPASFRANNGLSLASIGSNVLEVSGVAASGHAGYYLTAGGVFAGITGFRLETLVGGNGALGASANGNFVLTEFGVATDGSINRAMAAPVSASAATWPGFPAALITDGSSGSLSHPGEGLQTNFSYLVDLELPIALTSLELVNRTDGCCPERLSNFRVEVLNAAQNPVWTGDIRIDGSNSGVSGVDTITAAMGTGTFSGQYVRVSNLSGQPYNPQMSELRAFGAVIPEPAAASLLAGGLSLVLLRRGRQS